MRIADARVALVCAEWHVAYNESALGAFDYAFGVVNHLVESNGECGYVAGHYV